MYLTPHFTLEEATVSQTAKRLGIDNMPRSAALLEEIKRTAEFMERVREALLDNTITINSWYRCPALEKAITGRESSSGHHPLGGAVDFICPNFGTPLEVCRHLESRLDELGIGQLIHEYDGWTHISRMSVPNPINRVITIDVLGTLPGLHPSRA